MSTKVEIVISEIESRRSKRKIPKRYKSLSNALPIKKIRTESEFKEAMGVIRKLMPIIDKVTDKGVSDYFEALTTMTYEYEKIRREELDSDPVETIKYLMKGHNLKQGDLTEELGGQSVVSEILNRKRQLNISQIKKLASRFKVNPAVFID